jgi:hypothetical protein
MCYGLTIFLIEDKYCLWKAASNKSLLNLYVHNYNI